MDTPQQVKCKSLVWHGAVKRAMLQIWCAQKGFKQKAHALAILCRLEFSWLTMDC